MNHISSGDPVNIVQHHFVPETSTPEHLRACLIRWMNGRNRYQNNEFLEIWQKKHGKASADQLRSDAIAAYKLNRELSRQAAQNARDELKRVLA